MVEYDPENPLVLINNAIVQLTEFVFLEELNRVPASFLEACRSLLTESTIESANWAEFLVVEIEGTASNIATYEIFESQRLYAPTAHGILGMLIPCMLSKAKSITLAAIDADIYDDEDSIEALGDSVASFWWTRGKSDQLQMFLARLRREQILISTSIKVEEISETVSDYRYADVKEITGIESNTTISNHLKKAGLPFPERGQNNFRMHETHFKELMKRLSKSAGSIDTQKRAAEWLKDNR